MNAFVEATPTSGPACVARTPSTRRAIAEPGTFTTPTVLPPSAFASLRAATVSAVSPDCEIPRTSVRASTSGARYRNSDA